MASLEQLLERKLVFYFLKANNEKVYLDGKLPGKTKKNENKGEVHPLMKILLFRNIIFLTHFLNFYTFY